MSGGVMSGEKYDRVKRDRDAAREKLQLEFDRVWRIRDALGGDSELDTEHLAIAVREERDALRKDLEVVWAMSVATMREALAVRKEHDEARDRLAVLEARRQELIEECKRLRKRLEYENDIARETAEACEQ